MTKEYKTFSTGARREKKTGKGRYDLISPIAIQMLADVLEEGAEKIADPRNWERGLPISSYIDSALRHIFQHLEGRREEPHLRNAMWNLMAAIHTDEMIHRGRLPKELNDLPCYTSTEVRESKASPNRSFVMGSPDPASDPDLNTCPICGEDTDMGFDRCVPPNPYPCSLCQDFNQDAAEPSKTLLTGPQDPLEVSEQARQIWEASSDITLNIGDKVETMIGLTGVVVSKVKQCYRVKLDATGTIEILHPAEVKKVK